jgi:hypothetical protein
MHFEVFFFTFLSILILFLSKFSNSIVLEFNLKNELDFLWIFGELFLE